MFIGLCASTVEKSVNMFMLIFIMRIGQSLCQGVI
jgi:hypothetical protein